jgi:hypothetical protein
MAGLLTHDQWRALRRLYHTGKIGIPSDSGGGYNQAGPWPALKALCDHDPPLAREVFRTRQPHKGQYMIVITDAGEDFYAQNERRYDALYPPGT